MKTRKATLPMLTREASFSPETMNEKDRTIELVWTTGERVLRGGFWTDPFYEELLVHESAVNMERADSGRLPLLVSHENHPDSVAGIFKKIWIEDGVGRALAYFPEGDEVSDKYFQKAKIGLLRNVSVGFTVQTWRDITTDEDRYQVLQAISWTPMEISLVAVGADASAGTRTASQEQFPCTIEETGMKKRIESPAPAQGVEPVSAGAEQEPVTTTQEPEATRAQEPETQPVDLDAIRAEGVRAEAERRDAIELVVRQAGLPHDFARELIQSQRTVEDARTEIFNELEKRNVKINPSASVQAGSQDEVQTKREAAVEALLHRVNPSKFEMTEKGKRFHGMSLLRMAEEFAGRGTAIDIATRALSSSDLPIILADVARKQLQREYQAQDKQFLDFTSVGSLPDFREMSRPQLNDVSDLAEVGEDGEFKIGIINESGEKTQLGYFGRKFVFTYKMLVNDDLGVIGRMPGMISRSAIRLENSLVFGVLTGNHKMADGQNLFHANHKNLVTGAAMSEAKIDELVQKIQAQKTSDSGDFLGLNPDLLIAGPQNGLLARKLTAIGVVPGSSADVPVYAGIMKPIISPWISGKEYFVGCSKEQADGIEVQYLDGQPEPILTSERDFDTSGLKMKVEHHFGVKALDYRPFAKNPGA